MKRWATGTALGLMLGVTADGLEAQQAILRYDSLQHPVQGRHGMVASQRTAASAVGAAVLDGGGNAVDAAVAVGFALAVTLPRAGNLGGGGFLLYRRASDGHALALDFRERAPAGATADMFLNAAGEVDQARYRSSLLAAGVPGTVAGLHHIWQQHGSLPWADLIAPAVELARTGFIISYDQASAVEARRERLSRQPYARSLFFKPDGSAYRPGERWRQPELAATLERIATGGRDGFYRGATADRVVELMQEQGGLITHKDLAGYQVTERTPIQGEFAGHQVLSMPPPSSGGVHLVQMLNVLSHFPLREYGVGSARTLHVLAETMKRAYADRSRHLGDPDFHAVPVEWLTSATYASQLAATITPGRATPSAAIAPGTAPAPESPDTTHYSVMDQSGNAVAVTYTLNFSFGSGLAVPGAGFLLNNEMTDFAARPGEPDGFGLITGQANAIAPGKRPLSAMTPTLLVRDGRTVLVTGSPGGSRIINTVLQHVLGITAFGQNVAVAAHSPRIHHQWQPDRLQFEPGVNPDALELLRAWGHPVQAAQSMGSVQAVAYDGTTFFGSADPRRPGAAAVPAAGRARR